MKRYIYVCLRKGCSCTECPRVTEIYVSVPKCRCGHSLMLSRTTMAAG